MLRQFFKKLVLIRKLVLIFAQTYYGSLYICFCRDLKPDEAVPMSSLNYGCFIAHGKCIF